MRAVTSTSGLSESLSLVRRNGRQDEAFGLSPFQGVYVLFKVKSCVRIVEFRMFMVIGDYYRLSVVD